MGDGVPGQAPAGADWAEPNPARTERAGRLAIVFAPLFAVFMILLLTKSVVDFAGALGALRQPPTTLARMPPAPDPGPPAVGRLADPTPSATSAPNPSASPSDARADMTRSSRPTSGGAAPAGPSDGGGPSTAPSVVPPSQPPPSAPPAPPTPPTPCPTASSPAPSPSSTPTPSPSSPPPSPC